MLKYCQIVNEETGVVSIASGTNIEYYQSIGMVQRDVEQSDVDGNWYLAEKCPHLTPEEKEEQEKERIAHLKCTKRVLALMLQELGITYTALKELIATNEQAQLEWDLCIELERCNPLLDIMGSQLGLSPEQIDQMFKYANGEVGILAIIEN